MIPILDFIADIEEPDDITDFVMPLEAYITLKDVKGSDGFSFRIMTPKRLAKIYDKKESSLLRAIFIVNGKTMQENIDYITEEINQLLLGCERETWEETALAINYYLNLEYYDPSYGICDFYLSSRNLK